MKIKKSLALALTIALSLLSAAPVAAEDLPGKVSEVFVGNDGTLTVDLAGDGLGNLHLCSVSTLTRTVTTAACGQIASLLMAAKLSGIPVVIAASSRSPAGGTSHFVTVNYVKFAN